MYPALVSSRMPVQSLFSLPSNPPATDVPSGGGGSQISRRIVTSPSSRPPAVGQPRAATLHEPVPEEPFRLGGVRLHQVGGLGFDRVDVDPPRALVDVLEDPSAVGFRVERDRP